MLMRLVLGLGLLTVFGCGGDDGGGRPPGVSLEDMDAAAGARECIDEDGDGFGQFCDDLDCDDEDPDVTDECYRCGSPAENCPCEPGTDAVFCDPPDIEVEGGLLVCSEGTRYCRDSVWSECEIIGDYVFVATGD